MILKKVYLPEPPSIGRTMNVKPRRRKKRKGGGFSWSTYWATRTISGLTITVDSDTQFTLNWTNDGVADYDGHKIYISTDGINYTLNKTVTSVGTSTTVTGLAMYTRYYIKVAPYVGSNIGSLSSAANDWTAWKAVLSKNGDGSGTCRLRFRFDTVNVVATLDGTGRFYSDQGGTADESSSFTFTSGSNIVRYAKVNGQSNLLIFAKGNWRELGDSDGASFNSNSVNSPSVLADFSNINELTTLWTYAFHVAITINGSIPSNVLNLSYLDESSIGKLTHNLTSGIPSGLTRLRLSGNLITLQKSDSLPTKLTFIILNGTNINWTGLDIGNDGNITTLSLLNYRIAKMSSADMVTLLTQMTNRTGALPATVTINDYADYASPPAEVVAAVDALKAAKSITTVNLGE